MGKKITVVGMLIATAFVFSFVELAMPFNLSAFGIKIGLANIVVVFSLYKLDIKEAMLVCIIKIFISGLSFGGPTFLIYSLCGGILSFLIMLLTYKKLSITTVSILGAVFHNIGQILCAMFMLSTASIITYLPILLIGGVITGVVIGLVSKIAVERIKI